MAYQEEAVSGAGGIVLGAIFPPNTEWFVELHDVWVFMWPLISGFLMGLGTHVAKKLIEKSNQKKNKK